MPAPATCWTFLEAWSWAIPFFWLETSSSDERTGFMSNNVFVNRINIEAVAGLPHFPAFPHETVMLEVSSMNEPRYHNVGSVSIECTSLSPSNDGCCTPNIRYIQLYPIISHYIPSYPSSYSLSIISSRLDGYPSVAADQNRHDSWLNHYPIDALHIK